MAPAARSFLKGVFSPWMGRLDEKISALESRFDAMEHQFGELHERMAHLERLREAR